MNSSGVSSIDPNLLFKGEENAAGFTPRFTLDGDCHRSVMDS